MRNKIETTCKQCNKTFGALPSELRRGGGKYCTVKCYRKSQIGCVFTEERKRNISKSNLGRSPSKETREKISKTLTGRDLGGFKRHCVTCGTSFRCNPSDSTVNCSKPCSSKYLSETRSGENSPSWRGGLTPIHLRERRGIGYAQWRKNVFAKDNHTCVKCGEKNVKLQADHILPFSLYKELRLSLDNGQTLCVECHLEKTKKDKALIHKLRKVTK